MVLHLEDCRSTMSEGELVRFTSDYYIPWGLHPEVPGPDDTIADFPAGKVGVYTRFFEWANHRVPMTIFLDSILQHYRLRISQLHVIGAGKIANFEVNCRLLAIEPTLHLFRAFYHTTLLNGWVTFSKRPKDKYNADLQCFEKNIDKLPHWREKFFWLDDAFFPHHFFFHTRDTLPRDARPDPSLYSAEDAALINGHRIPIRTYPEEFLVFMGISRNYYATEHEVPTFLDANGAGACCLSL